MVNQFHYKNSRYKNQKKTTITIGSYLLLVPKNAEAYNKMYASHKISFTYRKSSKKKIFSNKTKIDWLDVSKQHWLTRTRLTEAFECI